MCVIMPHLILLPGNTGWASTPCVLNDLRLPRSEGQGFTEDRSVYYPLLARGLFGRARFLDAAIRIR